VYGTPCNIEARAHDARIRDIWQPEGTCHPDLQPLAGCDIRFLGPQICRTTKAQRMKTRPLNATKPDREERPHVFPATGNGAVHLSAKSTRLMLDGSDEVPGPRSEKLMLVCTRSQNATRTDQSIRRDQIGRVLPSEGRSTSALTRS
jgi:hypothetical protein